MVAIPKNIRSSLEKKFRELLARLWFTAPRMLFNERELSIPALGVDTQLFLKSYSENILNRLGDTINIEGNFSFTANAAVKSFSINILDENSVIIAQFNSGNTILIPPVYNGVDGFFSANFVLVDISGTVYIKTFGYILTTEQNYAGKIPLDYGVGYSPKKLLVQITATGGALGDVILRDIRAVLKPGIQP